MPEDALVIAIPVFLVIVTMAIVGVAGKRDKKRRAQRQQVGFLWLYRLRILLSHIQQHRGLTAGYLNGSSGLLPEIEELQRKARQDISEVLSIDPWMEGNERWSNINQHWERLSENFRNNNIENNLSQHSTLIQNILFLIEDMAQEHELLLLKTHDQRPLHLLWRELLTAGELIGQSRAIGTAVAAVGHCDSISRIRLNYLCQKIETNIKLVWKEIPPYSDQQEKIDKLLLCVNEDIITTKPSIKPDDFFKTASDALNSLHNQYDQYLESRLEGALL